MILSPSLVFAVATCAVYSAAQAPHSRPAASQPTESDFKRPVAAWIKSEHTDPALLSQATQAVIDGGKPALRHLRALADKTDPETAHARAKAIEALLRDVTLGHLKRVRDGDVFFAGQFEALEELQPWAGKILLELVIDTPTWFPINLRASVVPALRDLFANGPDEAAKEALFSIARDEVYESPDLRNELACAFAQWGDKSLIEPELRELEESAGPGESADDLYFVRRLAHLHYRLRDYRAAGRRWTEFLRGSEALETTPFPFDYYNAACSLSLGGDIRAALAEIERCGALLQAGAVDDSHRIERKLFEEDPELRAIRPTRRFQKVIEDTFGGETR